MNLPDFMAFTTETQELTGRERGPDTGVVRMFEAISPTYDFLNRLFSFRRDIRWRRECIRALDVHPGQVILDCAAGTGDMAVEVRRRQPAAEVVLLDPAESMLERSRKKMKIFPQSRVQLIKGNAEELPFTSHTFDRIMVAFGIRNFRALNTGLAELFRVTRPGGKGAILEFTPDRLAPFQGFFRFYFSHVIKPVGTLVSGSGEAYDHLQASIDDFPSSSDLCRQLTQIGWTMPMRRKLSGGVVTLFVFEKRA